jgi:hypothetical protein
MLAITHTPEELRLLEAADIADANLNYDQQHFVIAADMLSLMCGTPGCLLGGYAAAHPETWVLKRSEFVHAMVPMRRDCTSIDQSAWIEFGLTSEESALLFDGDGCGDAGKDGHKAAAFARQFVAEHAKQRLQIL